MAVYMCRFCGTLIESNSAPSTSGCPKKGTHGWVLLCRDCSTVPKPGLHAYQCRFCGAVVYSKSVPLTSGCPARVTHSWLRLS